VRIDRFTDDGGLLTALGTFDLTNEFDAGSSSPLSSDARRMTATRVPPRNE